MGLEKDTKEMRAIFRLFNPAPVTQISAAKSASRRCFIPRELTVEKIQLHGVDRDSLYAAGNSHDHLVACLQALYAKFVIRDYQGGDGNIVRWECPA